MIKKITYSLIFLLVNFSTTFSQEDINYLRERVKEREIVPYPHIREADVMYNRKICRTIDTREKQNKSLHWARNPLWRIVYNGATTSYGGKTLKAYKNDSLIDSRYGIYDLEELLERGGIIETITLIDSFGWEYDTTITTPYDPKETKKYRVCEEWLFDKQRSMFFSRIYAIAPLYSEFIAGREIEQALFWVKYSDLRKILINEPIFNPHNDGQRLTFDDFFELRLFSSYITFESNVYNRDINEFSEFSDPFNAILESEEVKKRLFDYEHDLWEW